ncbi:DUF6417 family protein [Streptomyces adustus]|uniref:DUF6417 family protein n=1 Tax=Streptomyces adustus TaxID=1609272 RepID=UPI0035E057B2
MDDYEHIDLDAVAFAPVAHAAERLALLTLLVVVAHEGGNMSPEAERLAREIAVRIPSEN